VDDREERSMKADPTVQRRMLDLAEIDGELVRLAHRRRNLPEHTALTAAEAAARRARDALVEVETRTGDLDRDIRRLERDVEAVRARTERDQKILAGTGVGAKQANDLQHELDTLARRQAVLEDEQLEIMEQREALDVNLEHSTRAMAEADAEQAAIIERRDATLRDIDAAEAGRRRAREEVVADLPADLLAEYDRRRARSGVGAALLRERRCGACRLELDRTALSALRAAPPDDVVHCEECGTVLVRTPQSGL
jgi:uncharacterized protein